MISFIIIGRNVQSTIYKCIQSVFFSVSVNNINKFEIIYVDSNSNDNSVEIVKQFKSVRVCLLNGEYNAAIARNVGFKEAVGLSLFFIDGDMELISSFLPLVLNLEQELLYDFVSGDLLNYYYNSEGIYLNYTLPYFGKKLTEDIVTSICGGVFAIKRILWEKVGGMKTYFTRNEDIDFSLRLARCGVFLVRKKDIMIKHHTISYYEKNKLLEMLKSWNYLYSGLTARKHFFNKHATNIILKNNSSAFVLLLCIAISGFFGIYVLMIYTLTIILRSVLKTNKETTSVFIQAFIYLIIDLQTLIGFIFYYPKNKKISYIEVGKKTQ